MIDECDYEDQIKDFMEGYLDGMKSRPDFIEMKKGDKQDEIMDALQSFKEHLAMMKGIKMMHDFNKTESIFLNKILGVN